MTWKEFSPPPHILLKRNPSAKYNNIYINDINYVSFVILLLKFSYCVEAQTHFEFNTITNTRIYVRSQHTTLICGQQNQQIRRQFICSPIIIPLGCKIHTRFYRRPSKKKRPIDAAPIPKWTENLSQTQAIL